MYLDKNYEDKLRILIEYASKEEIRYYLELMCDECINNEPKIIIPYTLRNETKISSIFNEIISLMKLNELELWNIVKSFLTSGFLSYKIIRENDKIIDIQKIKISSIQPTYDPKLGKIWTQFPNENIILDSDIIYISYSDEYEDKLSYVESLIRPYNLLKISEVSLIHCSIHNSTISKKFTIPTNSLSKQKSEEKMKQFIARYSEDIMWDDTIGEITINGDKNIPIQKEYYFNDEDYGEYNLDILTCEKDDIDHLGYINYFEKKLKIAAKFSDDERGKRRLNKFITEIKNKISKMLLNPLLIQIEKEIPSLIGNSLLKEIYISI